MISRLLCVGSDHIMDVGDFLDFITVDKTRKKFWLHSAGLESDCYLYAKQSSQKHYENDPITYNLISTELDKDSSYSKEDLKNNQSHIIDTRIKLMLFAKEYLPSIYETDALLDVNKKLNLKELEEGAHAVSAKLAIDMITYLIKNRQRLKDEENDIRKQTVKLYCCKLGSIIDALYTSMHNTLLPEIKFYASDIIWDCICYDFNIDYILEAGKDNNLYWFTNLIKNFVTMWNFGIPTSLTLEMIQEVYMFDMYRFASFFKFIEVVPHESDSNKPTLIFPVYNNNDGNRYNMNNFSVECAKYGEDISKYFINNGILCKGAKVIYTNPIENMFEEISYYVSHNNNQSIYDEYKNLHYLFTFKDGTITPWYNNERLHFTADDED